MASTRAGVTLVCGNERHFGQVGIGTDHDRTAAHVYLQERRRREAQLGTTETLRRLPTPYALFPALLNPQAPDLAPIETDAASCAARVLAGEQDVFVNDVVALVAARYVAQVLTRQPLESFLTFVNLQGSLSVRPVPITFSNLDAYLEDTSETTAPHPTAGQSA